MKLIALQCTVFELSACENSAEAILKKLSVGGNIRGKKDNRKEGNFYFFFWNTFKYYANAVLTSSTDIKLVFGFFRNKT